MPHLQPATYDKARREWTVAITVNQQQVGAATCARRADAEAQARTMARQITAQLALL